MTESTPLRRLSIPDSADRMIALRKARRERSLVDPVDALLPAMIEIPEFRRLLLSVDNADAVEGSVRADFQEAARLLRDRAKAQKDEMLGSAKLTSIATALKRALHSRYNIGDEEVDENGEE